MKNLILKLGVLSAFLLLAIANYAQTPDAENCMDYPLFKRMENFYIYECTETYDEYEFVMGDNESKKLNGNIFKILYSYDSELGTNKPSKMDILKYYEREVAEIGGSTVYSKTVDNADWAGATFNFEKDSIKYWLGIYDLINNPVDKYTFVLFVEIPTDQVVEEDMLKKINAGEQIPLYINFESFETIIKPESESIIDELYKMLSDNPTLRIVIAGHTDNVGDEVINQILSEGRALSVKQALVDKGIPFRRIEAIGYGELKPISDNESVEGRARNRRVEIAKCVD